MKLHHLAAVAALIIFPLAAQAQQGKAPKPTNADAQKVAKAIAADKSKLKIYCDLADLAAQMDEAEQKKDSKAFEALADKMDKMSEQLGPDYVALMDGLQDMAPNSKEAEAIGKTLDDLDAKCGQ